MVRLASTSRSAHRLLHRLLDAPDLVQTVRGMSGAELHALVARVGLEDASELVALASAEQLSRAFDEDLWLASDDEEERFDAARFGLWLEVLLESGDAAIAERLSSLSLDLLCLAFGRLVVVADMDQLVSQASELDEEELDSLERALESASSEEWEGFRIIDAGIASWDAVIGALLALDEQHSDLLRVLLERCAALTESRGDSLWEVLSEIESLETLVRGVRDDRRAALGHVSLADARAFLRLAAAGLPYAGGRDPITKAYFRSISSAPRAERPLAGAAASDDRGAAALPSVPVVGRRPTTAEPAALAATGPWHGLVRRSLAAMADAGDPAHAARRDELAYLANVLLAASAALPRRLRPVEAVEVALVVCDWALSERSPAPLGQVSEASELASRLATTPMDELFRAGFRRGGDAASPFAALEEPVRSVALQLFRAVDGKVAAARGSKGRE